MDISAIANRIAVSFSLQRQNLVDKPLFEHVNHALRQPDAFGATAIAEALSYFGMTFDEKPGLAKPLRYEKLQRPVRNVYLWINSGKGVLKWKKDVDPLDRADIERNLGGGYTQEPEQAVDDDD